MQTTQDAHTVHLSVSFNFHNKTVKNGKRAYARDWKPVDWSLEQIVKHVTSGRAICVARLQSDHRAEADFGSAQLIGVDFDQGPSIDELMKHPFIANYAFLVYPTASSTPDKPRSRALFLLDEPITNLKDYKLTVGLVHPPLIASGFKVDNACKSAAQSFFGSTQRGYVFQPDKVLPLALLEERRKQQNKGRARPGKRRQAKKPPQAVVEAIEEALGVTSYNESGWSNYVPCPFREHEHDDEDPKAAWRKDKHILKCFKCGERWLAKDVAALLDIPWKTSAQRTQSREGADALTKDEVAADSSTDGRKDGGEHTETPTDDDVGDYLLGQLDGKYAYFHDWWQRYEGGWWQRVEALQFNMLIWDAMIHHKQLDYKPTQPHANSIAGYVKGRLSVAADRVDNAPDYINLRNGCYNLNTQQLEPHRADWYMTTQLTYVHDSTATCPRFLKFLDQVLVTPDGTPDPELTALVQEAFGYSLTTDTRYETGFWLYGVAGSGKSTLLNVLKALLGSAAIAVDLNMLDKNHYQLADIPGKRVIFCTEVKANRPLADHNVKQLISGEEIVSRQLYKYTVRFHPCAKLWWAMNELPKNEDRSNAIYRRLRIIPFHKEVPEELRDENLFSQFLEELPGIFNWAMEGLMRLRSNGKFTRPAQVAAALAEYREENDVESTFLHDEEWCVLDAGERTQSSDLYTAYKIWCELNGQQFKSSTKVAQDWERLGLKKKKSSNITYSGVSLTEPAVSAVSRRNGLAGLSK